jgi:hypothetical protein
MNRTSLRVSLALAVLSLAPTARASDPFADEIQRQLQLKERPLCTICHATLIGGIGTVNKPFGKNLQQKYGLILLDLPGLRSAIMQAEANNDDVDGDGVGDIAELRQGTDPNVAGEGGTVPDEVRHGCYCSAPRAATAPNAAGAVWLSGWALSLWRRRAARRRMERTT